jgi:hypothetical protein
MFLIKSLSLLNNIWYFLILLKLSFFNFFKKEKETVTLFVGSLDYILMVACICCFLLDLFYFSHSILNHMISLDFSSGDSILQMSNSNPGPGMPGNQGTPGSSGSPNNLGGNPGGFPGGPEIIHTHNTNVQIIHDDGSWSNTIRSLFIYSTGGLRFWANLSRGGSPTQRIFIIGTTVLGYQLSRVLQNTVNDPTYVLRHSRN